MALRLLEVFLSVEHGARSQENLRKDGGSRTKLSSSPINRFS